MMGVADGMFVEPSLTLMSIIDHDQIWIIADVIESQAALVRPRARVDARVPSQPGRTWTGVVDYIYPRLNADTRTVRVRMRFANPDLALKHNMFASVRIATPARDNVLTVPSEALIRTGGGDRVVIALGDGRFKPMPVKTGIAAGGKVEIASGLNEGDRVVASAQFLLDSESSLSAGLARLDAPTEMASAEPAAPIWTEATVNSPPTLDRHVKLSHPPIPAIGWPAMTMDFAIDPAVPAGALVAGERCRINLAKNPDGTYRVVGVQPQASAP
jgi:Cu(I)/Ag(I) efflux system membrane fusion protein